MSRFSSEDKIGDVARITKRRPRGGFAAMRELFSQNDVFTIEFTDKSLTPEDKALILGNQLLLDFMFFEGGENEMCQTEDGHSQTPATGTATVCCAFVCVQEPETINFLRERARERESLCCMGVLAMHSFVCVFKKQCCCFLRLFYSQ